MTTCSPLVPDPATRASGWTAAWRPWARTALLVMVAFLATGCGCKPGMRTFNVVAAPEGGLTGTVEVALVGVSSANEPTLKESIDKGFFGTDYYKDNRSGIHESQLDPAGGKQTLLATGDPIWNVWRASGAQMLYVVTRTGFGTSNNVLPTLDNCMFEASVQNIDIRVSPTRVYMDTSPLPAPREK